MEFIITLLQDAYPYLHLQSFLGRFAWIIFFFSLLLLSFRLRSFHPEWQRSSYLLLAVFISASALGALFLGLQLPLNFSVPMIGQLGSQEYVGWMFLSQVPVVLAAGFLGPAGGLIAGGVSGSFQALFQTHNPFTILLFAFLGFALGWMFHQSYRTVFFRLISSPVIAGLLVGLIYPVLFLISIVFWLEAPLSSRLEYAFRLFFPGWAAVGGSLLIGGLVSWPFSRVFRRQWGSRSVLLPSPAETSIETRSFGLMGLVVAGLAGVLSIIGGFVAYGSALDLVEDRVASTAELAAETVPVTLEIGQDLLLSVSSDPRLSDMDEAELQRQLSNLIIDVEYFNQWLVLNQEGRVIAAEGGLDGISDEITQVENAGIDLALAGVPFQYYTDVVPGPEARAVMSFMSPVGSSGRILLGRSLLDDNTFANPLLSSLGELKGVSGAGILLDGSGMILFHPVREMIGTTYSGSIDLEGGLTEGLSADGSQVFVYAFAVPERAWTILVEVPVLVVLEQALRIAGPLLGLLLTLALVSTVLLRLILRFVTGSIRNLSADANRIAENPIYLDTPLEARGVDEVGVMQKAFERMRLSLKSRMDEQQQLLLASHGAASSLDFNAAVKPILNAALTGGAAAARVVLTGDALPGSSDEKEQTFGAGTRARQYAYLDPQILQLNKEQNPLLIRKPVANTKLKFQESKPIPTAILGVPLAQDDQYFGTLWIAYNRPHKFNDTEIRFLSTLGAQGALAVANAKLFMGAEIGRERLSAILASTPDPVIVTDQRGRLLLANPAACNTFGANLVGGVGEPVANLLEDEALVKLLSTRWEEAHTTEIVSGDGSVFNAKTTTVFLKNKELGTVCVMRDVSRFKELDDLKSDFVSTVGHDLKAPLVLLRGYATMVSVIGELTDEQLSYIHKITYAVDRMENMIADLLDLSRIETGFELSFEQVSPSALVAEVIDELRFAAREKEIGLEARIERVIGVQFEADKAFFKRALSNLVGNAIKYTESSGKVTISVEHLEDDSGIRFQVIDNGIGIKPVDQVRLFDKFFRAKERKAREQTGSGLGLAIVKSVVERHHGKVGVESVFGQGSKFTITVPEQQPSN